MKVESGAVVTLAVCISLSFYFSFLAFQSNDDAFKKQFVTFAATSVVASVVIVTCLIVYLGIRKAFQE